jgi:hypothetical protein
MIYISRLRNKSIENYQSGLWSIPESLSNSEWVKQKSNVVRYIASLYIDFPVSGITLWESPEVVPIDHYEIGNYETRNRVWMLDGHYRILGLIKAMDKESDLRIVFNPRVTDNGKGSEGQFRVASAMTRNAPGWIDVSRVLGSREDFCSVLEEESKEYRIRFIQLREILNKKIAVLKFTGGNCKIVVDVFLSWKMKVDLKRKGLSTFIAHDCCG